MKSERLPCFKALAAGKAPVLACFMCGDCVTCAAGADGQPEPIRTARRSGPREPVAVTVEVERHGRRQLTRPRPQPTPRGNPSISVNRSIFEGEPVHIADYPDLLLKTFFTQLSGTEPASGFDLAIRGLNIE
jgi:hypothetical protein